MSVITTELFQHILKLKGYEKEEEHHPWKIVYFNTNVSELKVMYGKNVEN